MKDWYIRRFEDKDAAAVSGMICRNFLEVNIKDYPREEMERLSRYYNPDKLIGINGNGARCFVIIKTVSY
jgi:hypothetical protein